MPTVTFADVSAGVRDAVAAYALALDDGRADDVVATFCADGTVDIPGLGRHAGHEALRPAFVAVAPKVPQRHLVVNTQITSWDATAATAESDLVLLVKGEAGWAPFLVGRYRDALRNEDGVWRFSERVVEFL